MSKINNDFDNSILYYYRIVDDIKRITYEINIDDNYKNHKLLLTTSNFEYAKINGIQIINNNFDNFDIKSINFNKVTFTNLTTKNGYFDASEFKNCKFENIVFNLKLFRWLQFDNCEFKNVEINTKYLRNIKFKNCKFENVKITTNTVDDNLKIFGNKIKTFKSIIIENNNNYIIY